MKRKKLKRRNLPFLFHLFALCADWTLVALTAGFLKMFSGERGTRKEEKEEKGETLKREESWWTHKLVYYFRILQQLTLVHFNFSLMTHPFLSLKSLLLICAKCLMLWDHSEYHLLDTAQGINSSNSFLFFFFSFSFKTFYFILISRWSLFSLSTQCSSPGLKDEWSLLVMLSTIFSLSGGVDMQLQFIRTVNTCI